MKKDASTDYFVCRSPEDTHWMFAVLSSTVLYDQTRLSSELGVFNPTKPTLNECKVDQRLPSKWLYQACLQKACGVVLCCKKRTGSSAWEVPHCRKERKPLWLGDYFFAATDNSFQVSLAARRGQSPWPRKYSLSEKEDRLS